MSNNVDMCYTEKGEVFVPDISIDEQKNSYSYHAMRGYGFVMAVYDMVAQDYVGFILAETLGFLTVEEFLADTQKEKN